MFRTIWIYIFLSGLIFTTLIGNAIAGDLGFRYIKGKCVDSDGKRGMNPNFIGQCGEFSRATINFFDFSDSDLSGSNFENSNLSENNFKNTVLNGVSFSYVNLTNSNLSFAVAQDSSFYGVRFLNTKFDFAIFQNVTFEKSSLIRPSFLKTKFSNFVFKDVTFESIKFDTVEIANSSMIGAHFENTDFRDCTLSNTNAQAAWFTNANFSNCKISSLNAQDANFKNTNFTNAFVQNSNFKGANLNSANFSNSFLKEISLVDSSLRATLLMNSRLGGGNVWTNSRFDKYTRLPFPESEALNLGMLHRTASNILIIYDDTTQKYEDLASLLRAYGHTVTFSSVPENRFSDSNELIGKDTVIYFNNTENFVAMPDLGRQALIDFVENGGKFIHTEWTALKWSFNPDEIGFEKILPFLHSRGSSKDFASFKQTQFPGHQLMENIPSLFGSRCLMGGGSVRYPHDTIVLMKSTSTTPIVLYRYVGKGVTIAFVFATFHREDDCLSETHIWNLFLNAVKW